jgi:hypothetical protein
MAPVTLTWAVAVEAMDRTAQTSRNMALRIFMVLLCSAR